MNEPFQMRVAPWIKSCFGDDLSAIDLRERAHRFVEEAMELAQATGCTEDEAHDLVRYVFGRPSGAAMQEVGGVMMTLAALCLLADIDMHKAADVELDRCWANVAGIRAKHASKPHASPLPGGISCPPARARR